MKRVCILAVVAAVIALYEAEILTECPIVWNEWETLHIPHETNPHWFYKCDHGRKVLFECPMNKNPPYQLCYNRELQVCDWPWNVTNCGSGPGVPTQPPTRPPTVPTQPPTWPPTWPPTVPTQPPTWPPTVPTQPPTQPPTWPPTVPTQPPTQPPTWPPTVPTQPPTRPPTVPTQPPTQPPTWPPTVPTQPPTRPPTVPTQPPTGSCTRRPHESNCKMFYESDGTKSCCLENQVYNRWLCVCDIPRNVPSCNPIPSCEY